MKSSNFIIGKDYRDSLLPEEDTEELTITSFGQSIIGLESIHINFHNENKNVWFILDGVMGDEYVYKCVYNQ